MAEFLERELRHRAFTVHPAFKKPVPRGVVWRRPPPLAWSVRFRRWRHRHDAVVRHAAMYCGVGLVLAGVGLGISWLLSHIAISALAVVVVEPEPFRRGAIEDSLLALMRSAAPLLLFPPVIVLLRRVFHK